MDRRDFLRTSSLSALALGAGQQFVAPTAHAGPAHMRVRGITGRRAPDLDVKTWFNLPPGKRSVDLSDFDQKVLYLYFFQSWCPGCHRSGFPTLQKVSKHFAGARDVGFVAVQTVFEGFGTNTAERAREIQRRYQLQMPVGHDAGVGERGSHVMRRYRSGGTPWTVIVDRSRVVRFNAFHIRPAAAIAQINALRRA